MMKLSRAITFAWTRESIARFISVYYTETVVILSTPTKPERVDGFAEDMAESGNLFGHLAPQAPQLAAVSHACCLVLDYAWPLEAGTAPGRTRTHAEVYL